MDTRGHGRSLNYEETYSYVHMAEDVKRVLEFLNIDKAGFVGWSDGAVTSLILAGQNPELFANEIINFFNEILLI